MKEVIKKMLKNKKIFLTTICIGLIGGGLFLGSKIIEREPKSIYEVAVMVRSQSNSDPAEDVRTSLKYGDVLVVQKEGHKWSNNEKVSYLILKINLTPTQASKLTRPEERDLKKNELTEEEKKMIKEEGGEPRKEIILARQYRIELEKFEGFKPLDLLNGQPYQDEVYDWGIVKKK